MTLADWIISWLLITSPASLPDMATVRTAFPLLRGPIIALCVAEEIVDEREFRFTLTSPLDFMEAIEFIGKRRRELDGCPCVMAASRFGDRAAINEMLCLNRSYRKRLEERLTIDSLNVQAIVDSINETDQLYHMWDAARDAACTYYYVSVRRLALDRLRELIGPDNFARGRMPHYLPIWRFERVNR